MGDLSANFSLSEFTSASRRTLTAAERSAATWWARSILQPARDQLGPLRISSYVRVSDPRPDHAGQVERVHIDGIAVDVVPELISVRAAADVFAARYLSQYGGDGELAQVIDEGSHVHLARVLVPGALAGYLEGPDGEGHYPPTAPDPAAITAPDYRIILGALALAGVVYLIS